MSVENEAIEPPAGYTITVDETAGPAERCFVLAEHGIEVSRHATRGGALLAALKREIEKGKARS